MLTFFATNYKQHHKNDYNIMKIPKVFVILHFGSFSAYYLKYHD